VTPDLQYLDAHREEVVSILTDDDGTGDPDTVRHTELGREPVEPDITVDEDTVLPSDRCPNCEGLVDCARCRSLVVAVWQEGYDSVYLREEVQV